MKQTKLVVLLGSLLLAALTMGCGELDNPVGIESQESLEKSSQPSTLSCPPGTPLWPTDGSCRPQHPGQPQQPGRPPA